jgi:hypothetical protein
MNDWEKVELAFDLIQDAEVVQVFEDTVWIKVDREAWEELVTVSDESRSVGPRV